MTDKRKRRKTIKMEPKAPETPAKNLKGVPIEETKGSDSEYEWEAESEAPPSDETPEGTMEEELGEGTSPFGGFDLAGAIKMAQPLIDQAVADNLTKMNLPVLIQAAVKEQLQPLVEAAQAKMGGGNPTQAADSAETAAPISQGGHSPMQEQLVSQGLSMLIQKILGGGNSGGGDIAKLADTLKGVQTIAELANAPYRQGRHDALSETNATVKLLQGLGATDEKKLEIIAGATSKEIESE